MGKYPQITQFIYMASQPHVTVTALLQLLSISNETPVESLLKCSYSLTGFRLEFDKNEISNE